MQRGEQGPENQSQANATQLLTLTTPFLSPNHRPQGPTGPAPANLSNLICYHRSPHQPACLCTSNKLRPSQDPALAGSSSAPEASPGCPLWNHTHLCSSTQHTAHVLKDSPLGMWPVLSLVYAPGKQVLLCLSTVTPGTWSGTWLI